MTEHTRAARCAASSRNRRNPIGGFDNVSVDHVLAGYARISRHVGGVGVYMDAPDGIDLPQEGGMDKCVGTFV